MQKYTQIPPKKVGSELAALLRAKNNQNGNNSRAGLNDNLIAAVEIEFGVPNNAIVHALGRSSIQYWQDHARVTGALMEKFARQIGEDENLYRIVGVIHDADYIKFPHDEAGASGARHPVPLCQFLWNNGVSASVCLAILEHAPYLGLNDVPSSRLSAALSACEDLATLCSIDPKSRAYDDLSEEAQALAADVIIECPATPKEKRIRVETDVERFVNKPLALAIGWTAANG